MPSSYEHKEKRRSERAAKKKIKADRRQQRPRQQLRTVKKSRRTSDKQSLHRLVGPIRPEEVDDLYADPPPKKVSVEHHPQLRRRSRALKKKRSDRAAA